MESSNRIKFSSNSEMRQISSYQDVEIRPEILQTLEKNKILLKPVIQYTLDYILSQRHLLIISPSGLGRGLATIIGILNSIDLENPNLQALIISPTHNLAEEYYKDLNSFKPSLRFSSALCIGGTFIDISKLKCQIIIGTCGKILHFLNKKIIVLTQLKFIVCDIVNELFKERLVNDTEKILSFVSRRCVHWYLASKKKNFVKEKYFERVGNQGVAKFKLDSQIFECMKFFVKVCGNDDEQEFEVKRIVGEFGKKTIIFSQNEGQLTSYKNKLNEFSPKLLISTDSKLHQNKIITNFEKGKYDLLLCLGRGKFVRRLNSTSPSKLIFLDIPSKKEYFTLRLQRYNFHTDDEVFIIIPENFNALFNRMQLKFNFQLNPL